MSTKDSISTQITSAPVSAEAVLQHLFPPADDSSRLTVSCPRHDYSASAIARAVEDCDAHMLNLNVTDAMSQGRFSNDITVELRINHRNAMSVARSLERYGYHVLAVENAGDADGDTLRDRYNELIRILEI